MLYLNPAIIIIGIALSGLIFNSFGSFRNFHQVTTSLQHWDTAVLASTNHVTRKTNNFLIELRDSFLASLESYDAKTKTVDQSFNQERIDLLNNYLSSIDPVNNIDFKNTIEFGLRSSDQTDYQDYEITLLHSNYLQAGLVDSDQAYASTLISNENISTELDLHQLESDFIQDGKLQITEDLLVSLLNEQSVELISHNPALFALLLNESGISLPKLANSVQIRISTEFMEY